MSTIKVKKAATVHCENPPPPETGDTVIIEAPKPEPPAWRNWLGPVAVLVAVLLGGGAGFWLGRETAPTFDCRKISIGKTGIIHNASCTYYKKGTVNNCDYCGGLNGK